MGAVGHVLGAGGARFAGGGVRGSVHSRAHGTILSGLGVYALADGCEGA